MLPADLDNVATDIAIGAAMFRHGSSSEVTPTGSLAGPGTHPGDRVSILWEVEPILGANLVLKEVGLTVFIVKWSHTACTIYIYCSMLTAQMCFNGKKIV